MKLKMAKNSLFAVLLRSPWWISMLVAAAFALVAWAALPEQYVAYGIFGGTPFFVIGIIAACRQLRAPSAARVADTLQSVGAMSWRDFSSAIEDAFRRDGYTVTRLDSAAADFAIAKSGRTALVACKRWKAASTGIEPLRNLHAAAEAQEAHESIYITTGDVTDNARRFVVEKNIRVMRDAELTLLLRGMARAKKGST